jgi:hypothetical protein
MRWTRQRFACDGIAGRVERSVSGHRHADERCCSGRQNRVVLTPRRWRQVLRSCVGPTGLRQNLIRRRRWQESPVTEESAKETVKTIACGNAGRLRCTRCYSCAFYQYNCTRGRGCNGHQAFPTPSIGAEDKCRARAHRAARSRSCVCSSHRHCEERSDPDAVIPGWSAGPDPESRDSGFDAPHRPGMTVRLFEN